MYTFLELLTHVEFSILFEYVYRYVCMGIKLDLALFRTFCCKVRFEYILLLLKKIEIGKKYVIGFQNCFQKRLSNVFIWWVLPPLIFFNFHDKFFLFIQPKFFFILWESMDQWLHNISLRPPYLYIRTFAYQFSCRNTTTYLC